MKSLEYIQIRMAPLKPRENSLFNQTFLNYEKVSFWAADFVGSNFIFFPAQLFNELTDFTGCWRFIIFSRVCLRKFSR